MLYLQGAQAAYGRGRAERNGQNRTFFVRTFVGALDLPALAASMQGLREGRQHDWRGWIPAHRVFNCARAAVVYREWVALGEVKPVWVSIEKVDSGANPTESDQTWRLPVIPSTSEYFPVICKQKL